MIECKGLSKNFRIYHKEDGFAGTIKSLFVRKFTSSSAVDSFDLSVKQGEIVGLLGPNGAGKTTLMKMFTGIIEPSLGNLQVLNQRPFSRAMEFRKNIALVMGQKSQLWWDIPALDSLRLLKEYYEISEEAFQERLNELCRLLDINSQLKVHVRKLSLGERMKMELMASLLHQPKILFLDEPTIGLDLTAQDRIREFLLSYHQKHKPTIILTSHYMADVEALCERIVLILAGKKHFDGSIEDFSKILGSEKFVQFRFQKEVSPDNPCFEGLKPVFHENGQEVELRIDSKDLNRCCARILQELPVVDFHTERLPIERVMKELMSSSQLDTP